MNNVIDRVRLRIVDAYKKKKTFRVIICIPLLPEFEGTYIRSYISAIMVCMFIYVAPHSILHENYKSYLWKILFPCDQMWYFHETWPFHETRCGISTR